MAKPTTRYQEALTLASIIREQTLAEQYSERLKPFLKAAWPTIEPGVPFVDGWHIDCLCLPGETRIITEVGPMTIEAIVETGWQGRVLSYCHATAELEWKPAITLMKSAPQPLVKLSMADGKSLQLSENHPVFVVGKGYVRADQVNAGESVLKVCAMRDSVPSGSITTPRRLLQPEMLRGEQGQARNASVSTVRRQEIVGREEMQGVRREKAPQRGAYALSALRKVCLPNASAVEGKRPALWCILRTRLLRGILERIQQSSLYRWASACRISRPIWQDTESCFGPRFQSMLPVFTGRPDGRTPYRPEQSKQRGLESRDVMPPVSQPAKGHSVGEYTAIECVVSSVEREVRVCSALYNIEVADNNNYVAEGVLVHNCEHVQALFARQIRRLIINISPRSTKSTVISIAAPAWRWINNPEESFLCASFSKSLSLNFSRKTRSLIKSPWYQSRWGSRYKLTIDQDEKGEFENDKGGYRLATSVEGGVLGRGGSVGIYDDSNDLSKMQFPDYRQSVREWYSGSASSRHINPKTDVRLCVQQRASYGEDLTAFLLELGDWEQITIPNEFDGRRTVSSIGWSDPRTHIGELMCPERLGPEETARQKRESRSNYLGQFQQAPITDAGGVVKREWFRFYNPAGITRVDDRGEPIPVRIQIEDGKFAEIIPITIPDAFEQVLQSHDMAFKNAEHNDFVAGHVWARVGSNSFLLHREHGHMTFTETKAMVRRMSQQFPCPQKLVEDKANGTAIMDELRNEIPGLIAVEPYGSKESRYAAISGYIEAGNVYLPNPDLFPWVWEVLAEFCDGRAAKHDDDRDAMAQALKRLYDSMAQAGVPEFRVQPRLGEPDSACHIAKGVCPVEWRRVVAIVPGAAALWLAETPSGSLRVLRELSLDGIDAAIAGREIGRLSLPDAVERTQRLRIVGKRQAYELLMPKEAFAAIEPIGSYAEMLEAALLSYQPTEGDWDAREFARVALREAHFRSDMVQEEDAALDRLRSLLAFQPPGFEKVPYDRQKALALAETDLIKYQDYMAATDGTVRGEWPRLKIDPGCRQLIAELGSYRKDRPDEAPPMVRALLLAVSCPSQAKPTEIVEKPWPAKPAGRRNQTLLSRKFAMN